MSRVHEVGDNINYTADSGVGFDSEGYLLEPGTEGDRNVQIAQPVDATETPFVGVTHKSTYNYDETEVLTGQPVGAIQDGIAMMLAVGGVDYNQGDVLHFPSATAGESAGVASKTDTSNTEVGSVVEGYDASADSGPVLLKVRVDGRV